MKYDDHEIAVTFTYREWSLLSDCVSKRRRDMHDRADMLDLDDSTKNAVQINALRRKATELFELQEEFQGAMAQARVDIATSVGGSA